MFERLNQRLGLQVSTPVFWPAAIIAVVWVVLTIAFTDPIADAFEVASTRLLDGFGWFYILGVTSFVAFLFWIAFSRYGRIRLGDDDDRPEYSDPVWFGMLFAAGIGTIFMFWGVAEPLSHFADPPMGDVEPQSAAAARQAMDFTIYHFGLHTWAIFGLPALGFAYFAYRRKLPMRISSVLHPLLGDRIYGPVGHVVDTVAVLGTLFGLATSLGLGTMQINSGLSFLTPIGENVTAQVAIVTVVTLVATGSVVSGLDRGIKWLSNINIWLAIVLMVFVALSGPTLFLIRSTIESTGSYLTSLPELAFWTDSLRDSDWQNSWTVFYWAWTITWAPFVGIFIARISKGRTIRQFVLGVLLLPTSFTIVWFCTFGFAGMSVDNAAGGELSNFIVEDSANVPLSLFLFLEEFPLAGFVSGAAVLIIAIFFITSSDSASFVIDMLSAEDTRQEPPVRQRVFWALSEGAVAATLLIAAGAEGLEALENVITVLGLPFFLLGIFIMYALVRALRDDPGRRGAPPPDEDEAAPDVDDAPDGETEPVAATDTAGDEDAPEDADDVEEPVPVADAQPAPAVAAVGAVTEAPLGATGSWSTRSCDVPSHVVPSPDRPGSG